MTKKIITYLLAIMCICTCLVSTQVVWADAPNVSITVSDSSVDIGETITVTLTFTNDIANFSRVTGQLSYDSEVIELTSQDIGGGGILNISENATDLTDSIVITLTFQALKEGSSNFSLQDCQLMDDAGPVASPTATSKSVTVRNTSTLLSSNANLEELKGPGIWTPEFSPEITEYSIVVEYSVETFIVTGKAQDGNAKSVQITGDQNLKVGSDNQRQVVVTAQDGTTKTYTLNITREAPLETEGPAITETPQQTTQTQKPTSNPQQTQIQWGTPAQDVTSTPGATSTGETQPTPTIVPPTTTANGSSGTSVEDLTNAAVTTIVIIAIIIVVILFTVIYCMQQSENKKKGKKKKK